MSAQTFNLSNGNYIDFEFEDVNKEPDEDNKIQDDHETYNINYPQPQINFKQFAKRIEHIETPEDIKKHQEILIKLSRYASSQRFADYLRDAGFNLDQNRISKLSLQKLQDLLTRVQVSINARNSNSFVSNIIFAGINTVENISIKTKIKDYFDLEGYTDLLKDDPEFADLIHQLELEYFDITSISPEKRLVLLLVMNALKVSGINKLKKRLRSESQPARTSPQPSETPSVETNKDELAKLFE